MRDNKPLELEAENYVCSKIAKLNLKYAKPNFDLNGGDLIIINQITNDTFKSINVQVKGRDITTSKSNVTINQNYVNENFVFFLYLRKMDDLEDYLFCFFAKDIVQWELKENNYYLYIPEKSIENVTFQDFRFSTHKATEIKEIINRQIDKSIQDNVEWNLTFIENNLRLWELTNCLPDPQLTSWFLNNMNLDYTLSCHDVFLTCITFINSNDLQSDAAIDWMFIRLKEHEIKMDASITNVEIIRSYNNDWLMTYKNSTVELLNVTCNNHPRKGLRLIFGDNEEKVECLLIDNGQLNIEYTQKK